MIEKVNFLVATGKYEEAQTLLDHLILSLPNDTSPVIMAGDLFYGRGKFEESLIYYDKALSMNHKDAQVWIKKGDVYLAMSVGDMQKIRERYKGLTSNTLNKSSSSDAVMMDAYRETGSFRQAQNCYNEAIKINPMKSVEIAGRVLASTQNLVDNEKGILDDIGNGDTVSNRTEMEYLRSSEGEWGLIPASGWMSLGVPANLLENNPPLLMYLRGYPRTSLKSFLA
jgi:tetratricopeptide (TPR) repeat protein